MVIFSIGLFVVPGAFADVTVTNAVGSATPGCEETNSCFIPTNSTINVGETVTWENSDNAAHTATSGTASDGPDGVWDSSLMMVGGSYSVVLDTAGTYPYHCVVHPWMQGYVTVIEPDTTPPVITVPENTVVRQATNSTGHNVSFYVHANDDALIFLGAHTKPTREAVQSLACSPTNNDLFPIGDTTVTCTATDTSGNVATASFTVTVLEPEPEPDTTPPQMLTPDDIIIESDNQNGATATFNPQVTDNVDGLLTPTCNPASGTIFPIGDTTVTCTATDTSGNVATASFTVTVLEPEPEPDTTPPVIQWSEPDRWSDGSHVDLNGTSLVRQSTNSTGYNVGFTVKAVDDIDGSIRTETSDHPGQTKSWPADNGMQLTCSSDTNDLFPIGDTTVTCTATDTSGNVATASFTVTVLEPEPEPEPTPEPEPDTISPEVLVPGNITQNTDNPNGKAVSFNPQAIDNVDEILIPTCNPQSGSVFPIGTTEVTCTATDSAGNTSSNSFSVTIDLSSEILIPDWIKNVAGFWHAGDINDASFLQGISYLIQNDIIVIPSTESGSGGGAVPEWVKNTAGWWADGQIDDETFVNAITYLIQQGLIQV